MSKYLNKAWVFRRKMKGSLHYHYNNKGPFRGNVIQIRIKKEFGTEKCSRLFFYYNS